MKTVDLTPDQNRALEHAVSDLLTKELGKDIDVEVTHVQDEGDCMKLFYGYDEPKTEKPRNGSLYFKANILPRKIQDFRVVKFKNGKVIDESLNEKVYTFSDPSIQKRGAPTGQDRARAFDRVNPKTGARPDRSFFRAEKKAASQDQSYGVSDISEDPDYTMVLVLGGNTEPYTAKGEEYHGVNVLFYPSGKISASTADSAADWQWKHHKEQIIAAAKKALKKHKIDPLRGGKPERQYSDYHGYNDPKTNEGKLTFKQFLLAEAVADRGWFNDKKQWKAAASKLDVDDDGDDWAKCDGKLVAKWYDDRNEGWVDDSHMKPVKEATKFKKYENADGTWYVEDLDEKVVLRNATKAEAEHAVAAGNEKAKAVTEAKKGPFGIKLGGVSDEDNSFGFEDRLNAQKTDSELKSASIKFTRTQAGGIFYFHFDSAADMKKAVRLAKKVIDKSEESEW